MTSTHTLTHSYYSAFYAEKGYQFLEQIAQTRMMPKNLIVFTVMHCYEGSLPYLNVLCKLADHVIFIPKQATFCNNGTLLNTISSIPNCDVVTAGFDKIALRDPMRCLTLIEQYTQPGQAFLILDHGGYFAQGVEAIFERYYEQCVGIAELTANGIAKYRNRHLIKPLVSVAHLSIKTPADYEASECIVHYTDQILREAFGLKLNNLGFLTIGVIGSGNLGRGICKTLQGKGIHEIYVSDQDPRQLTALPRNGIQVCSTETMLKHCNLIFCCTGNGALHTAHIQSRRENLFIATVTSADDELNLPDLVQQGTLKYIGGNQFITEYQNRHGASIYLIAGGESANTPFKTGMGDPTLYLFEAAHLLAGLQLSSQSHSYASGIQALSAQDEIFIAEQWLRFFYSYT
ncbi:NAD(P)-binding domain-containing protein [Photobacterium sp. TLY01]|uniref:NAD(P)-binding domain-containing protein n=1 Tax=Photobacterium sp. TLY01 TaxID=2907534 RepID=UPI001F3A8B01|nr:NAD(P)-binding domain-containing protein [Photobacterium sp. TLY01]UIP27986.1 NAD(P)-binding domain-containing protein [Photobacterium sp. TLY01]